MTLFTSVLLFFLAPAVNLTIFGAGLTILRMFQGCFDVIYVYAGTHFLKNDPKIQQMKGICQTHSNQQMKETKWGAGAVGPTTTIRLFH